MSFKTRYICNASYDKNVHVCSCLCLIMQERCLEEHTIKWLIVAAVGRAPMVGGRLTFYYKPLLKILPWACIPI